MRAGDAPYNSDATRTSRRVCRRGVRFPADAALHASASGPPCVLLLTEQRTLGGMIYEAVASH
eukprot:4248889-Pyramimonas_sp.AAC.1